MLGSIKRGDVELPEPDENDVVVEEEPEDLFPDADYEED